MCRVLWLTGWGNYPGVVAPPEWLAASVGDKPRRWASTGGEGLPWEAMHYHAISKGSQIVPLRNPGEGVMEPALGPKGPRGELRGKGLGPRVLLERSKNIT